MNHTRVISRLPAFLIKSLLFLAPGVGVGASLYANGGQWDGSHLISISARDRTNVTHAWVIALPSREVKQLHWL